MNFICHSMLSVAGNGVSIAVVVSCVKALLVRRAMKNHLPLTPWRFIGLFKIRRRLARSVNDPIRNVGSIAEIVDTPLSPPCLVFKTINIVPSVPISACVRKRTARCVWKNHAHPMNVWHHHGLLRMLFERETSSYNPIKSLSLTVSYAIISIRRRPIIIIIRKDRAPIVPIRAFAIMKSVSFVFRNHLPRTPRCSAGAQRIP